MSVLVIVEHTNDILNPVYMRIATAATQIEPTFDALVAGYECSDIANKVSAIKGCAKVLLVDHPAYQHHLVESLAELIKTMSGKYQHILIANTTFGKNLLPRIAGLLDVMPVSDVIEIKSPDTFIRPMHAGNIHATIKLTSDIKLLGIRAPLFDSANAQENAVIENFETVIENTKVNFIGFESPETVRPDLGNADIVISGGRALKSAENFKIIEELADVFGAGVGATRAAVDAGYVANEFQVGQTGTVVAPDLYFAIGISGAIQHIAGMKDSKTIVAINSDRDAAIFKIADYGLVADLFDVMPEIIEKLKK